MEPLSVRVSDGAGNDRHVRARNISWAKRVNSGWAELSLEAITPLGAFTDLGPNDRIFVYDGTGQTVMEGYAENPGQARGPGGESYAIGATGPGGLAHDSARPYVVIDQNLTAFERAGESKKNADTTADEIDADTPTLEVRAAEGKTVGTAWAGSWIYREALKSAQKLARVHVEIQAGNTDADYRQEIVTGVNGAVTTIAANAGANVTPSTLTAAVVTNFAAGHDTLRFRSRRINSATTGAEADWFAFFSAVIRTLQLDKFGADITTGYVDHAFTHAIVADMIGRGMLPGIDPDRATIESGTFEIEQFASYDGITGGAAMQMLSAFEPDGIWEYLESGPNGHRFAYRFWDDDNPRYLISERDGSLRPGGDNDLCNRVVVTWTDKKGRPQTTIVTSTVPALGSRVRDADPVSLPDGYGTAANALRLGEEILARRAEPSRAGQVLLRRRVMDLHLGRWVMPWELEAGWPALVQETGEVLRGTEVRYDHNSRAATMTLGTPTQSVEQLVARLTKRSSAAFRVVGGNPVSTELTASWNAGKKRKD